MQIQKKYKMSFTASSVRRRESAIIAELFLRYADWDAVYNEVLSDNILQLNSISSQKRIYAEIKLRLKHLSTSELQILANDDPSNSEAILWLAICRSYTFIGDFAKEVIHEKYISFQKSIEDCDYELFFEKKSSLHPELNKLTDQTKKKIKQIVFKMLNECGILGRKNEILAFYCPSELRTMLKAEELGYFPTNEYGVAR